MDILMNSCILCAETQFIVSEQIFYWFFPHIFLSLFAFYYCRTVVLSKSTQEKLHIYLVSKVIKIDVMKTDTRKLNSTEPVSNRANQNHFMTFILCIHSKFKNSKMRTIRNDKRTDDREIVNQSTKGKQTTETNKIERIK